MKFRNYEGMRTNENLLSGYTVSKVSIGINEKDTGLSIELERTIENATLGIAIIYNPCHEDGETELMISDEYVKNIDINNARCNNA